MSETLTIDLEKELTSLNEESKKLANTQQQLSRQSTQIRERQIQIQGIVNDYAKQAGEDKVKHILEKLNAPVVEPKKKDEKGDKETKPKGETKPLEGEIIEAKK